MSNYHHHWQPAYLMSKCSQRTKREQKNDGQQTDESLKGVIESQSLCIFIVIALFPFVPPPFLYSLIVLSKHIQSGHPQVRPSASVCLSVYLEYLQPHR